MALAALAIAVILAAAAAVVGPTLTFGPAGFKLAQVADVHYGEAPDLVWGPQQDANSTRVMRAVFAAESPLDLVVFSGDQITGNNVVANATAVLTEVYATAVALGLPFAAVYGNHDDAPLESGPLEPRGRRLSVTTRRQLLAFERDAYAALSLTCASDVDVAPPCPASLAPAVSNYVLVVRDGAGAPKAALFFLDSGGGTYAESLFANATAWLSAAITEMHAAHGPLPSLTFVHIPPPEYASAYPGTPGAPCVGLADDGITPTDGPNALVGVLRASGSARAVFVGHDHGNAWCCGAPGGVALCYGRHAGYGGYGDWDRGARIVHLAVNASAPGGVSLQTWVRMEDGSVQSAQWLLLRNAR